MKSPLRKIIAIFVSIILLPVMFFVVYELGSLSKNEEIIREIYKNQLDAILYSVNQYSDDIVNSWANKINMAVSDSSTVPEESHYMGRLLDQNPAIFSIFISDSLQKQWHLFSGRDISQEDSLQRHYGEILRESQDKITRLTTYQRGGFRKIEPIATSDSQVPLLFLLDEGNKSFACIIVLDPEAFITTTLAPKMQAISQSKFIISAFKAVDHTMVYATDENLQEDEIFNNQTDTLQDNSNASIQLRDFWLLPDYYLGISMKDASIDALVKKRAQINLISISILVLILIAGIWLIYRNLRREMQLSQAKAEFVSNVSHEIRTPLSLISMFAETLAMNRVKTEEKKKEYYEIIGKETSRLSGIVNRILNFSQMEANKRRFDFVPVDVNQIIREIFHSYDFHLSNKGFGYSLSLQEGINKVLADREALSEAVINLLDNAVKYSQDKKQIEVTTGEEKDFAFIEVKDYGMGISKGHQREIFDQFYRVPTGDIHNIKGSGLGLTLVKKIIEAHKGKITLDSTLGKGSAFRLHFPLYNAEKS